MWYTDQMRAHNIEMCWTCGENSQGSNEGRLKMLNNPIVDKIKWLLSSRDLALFCQHLTREHSCGSFIYLDFQTHVICFRKKKVDLLELGQIRITCIWSKNIQKSADFHRIQTLFSSFCFGHGFSLLFLLRFQIIYMLLYLFTVINDIFI